MSFNSIDMSVCLSDTQQVILVCTKCKSTLSQPNVAIPRPTKPHNKHFECRFCGKVFQFGSYLQRHMKTHSSVKQFVCRGCDRRYKHQAHLNAHMRSCKQLPTGNH
ncbi:Zinc finger protein 426 [Mizuhopecten yessoensis]|uniref:Zinc finger protein 426 n=1 Tax=Mizuhopecten yessoensis TaxID=6573 RepID=A0A210Q3F8_MIZYE|nr:Zinc finger protein 426 [Mizuhopecten yessoensis]